MATGTRLEGFAKYAGLGTVLCEWSALLLYYLRMPAYFGGRYPISYFGTLPQTRLVFNVCYTLAAACFWIFVRHHLSRHYRVPLRVFGLSLVLFALMALVPFDLDNTASKAVHLSFVYSSGLLFWLGVYLVGKRSRDVWVHRVSTVVTVLSAIFMLIFIFLPQDSDLIFRFEAGAWLMWQLWIVWISLYVHKRRITLE